MATGGIGAKLKKKWDDFFWVKQIFALEFGTSDVQANYSRVYAWMANQLGHMTLGLAVALLFVWISESSLSAIIKFTAWLGDAEAAPLACQWGWLCLPSNLMLSATFTVVIGGLAVFLLWWAWSGRCHQPASQSRANLYPRIPKGVAIAFHAGVALLLIGVVIYALGFKPTGVSIGAWTTLMSTLIATLVITAAIVVLCKDAEVLFLSLFGLAIVFVLGTGILNYQIGNSPARWEFLVIAALLLGLMAATWLLRYRDAEYKHLRHSGATLWREVAGLVFVVVFLGVLHFGLDPEWRTALTAAFASVTLWWVKEFGSDIPGVHEEIGRAYDNRPTPLPGSERDYDQVELDYLTDARMDARTDGLFYIAGAWIGAGVISDMPVLTDNSWETGAELVGCMIFIFIFMVEGKRWSFRQVALDRMGANRASRLAVFRSALKMIVIEPDAETPAEGPAPEINDYDPHPIDRLRRFAHGDKTSASLDHVFVIGALGSGRTPLGLALASEAALSCHSTINDGAAPRHEHRTGRYVQLHRLAHLLRDVTKRSELSAYPTQPVWFDKTSGTRLSIGEQRPKDGSNPEREEAASLVVIDDAAFVNGVTPFTACDALNLAAGAQQTVWMFPTRERSNTGPLTSSGAVAEWAPDYREYLSDIAALRYAITQSAGAPQRIAIVFVRRFENTDGTPQTALP